MACFEPKVRCVVRLERIHEAYGYGVVFLKRNFFSLWYINNAVLTK